MGDSVAEWLQEINKWVSSISDNSSERGIVLFFFCKLFVPLDNGCKTRGPNHICAKACLLCVRELCTRIKQLLHEGIAMNPHDINAQE